jgi:hypothetical protein
MAAPLSTCAREEQRSVIRFLSSEGVKATEIHRRMEVQYGDACLSLQQVYKWTRKFLNGVSSVADSSRLGQAHRIVTPEEHYMARGNTVTSATTSADLLKNHLCFAIKSKRRGRLSTGVLSQHDNARPHTARSTVATIQDLCFECLPHPP